VLVLAQGSCSEQSIPPYIKKPDIVSNGSVAVLQTTETTCYHSLRRARGPWPVRFWLAHNKNSPLSFGDVQFKSEEYISATAKTIEDAEKLVEAGFEYVPEIECVKLFRKRK
jgi:hypothetical protein